MTFTNFHISYEVISEFYLFLIYAGSLYFNKANKIPDFIIQGPENGY